MGSCGKLLLALIFTFATKVLCEDDTTMGPMFIKEPENRVDFSNTTGAIVECTARGSPRPEIIWIRADGTAVGDVPGLRQVKGDGNLVFPPFRAEDYKQEVHAQVYICMAKNRVGVIHSRDVNVRAVVNQLYTVNVMDESVLRGNTAILKCHIPSFVSDYVFVSSWTSDGGDEYSINANHAYDGKYLVLPSGELHIRDVTPEDGTKSYQCRTKHRLTGETRLSATKGRLVITDPIGTVIPKVPTKSKFDHVDGVFGQNIVLLCETQGHPVPVFRWYKFIEGSNKKQAVTLDDRIKQVSGTLIIREAKVDDSGKYLCVVNNSVGGESVETVLTVTAPLNAIVEPTIQTVDFGRPATLTCNYEGNPVKTISWLKDGKRLSSHDGRVLRIDSVRKEDKGMYQCFVRNEQESAQGSAELKLGGRFEPPHIKEYFNDNTMQPGVSLHLKCIASGNPTPEINWELDSKRLSSTERLRIGQHITMAGEVVSYLNISSVHTNDGGHYRCVAVSKVGTAEHTAHLNVYGLPFIRPMDKKNIVSGENLFVTCPVAGYPLESITWERDNRQLPINRKQKVFPNGTLIIENVERSSDQATYTCVARNAQGHTAKGNLEVQVMVPPSIMPFSVDGELSVGDNAQLTCHVARGDMPINISWTFQSADGGKVGSLPEPILLNRIGKKIFMLEIPSVTEYHRGSYTCIATNRAGVIEHTAKLMVNVPPRWILEPTDKAFAQGGDAKIECKADGFPKPQVTWKKAIGNSPGDYKDIKDLKPGSDDIKVDEGTLSIHNIQKNHEGHYLCEAVNGIGSGLSAVITISVQAPPHFEIKARNQTSEKGQPAVLECMAKGEKPIGIVWNMNNKRLDAKEEERYTIREEILTDGVKSDLSIKRSERIDTAVFTCVATNSFGSDDSSVQLIVQEVPEIPFGLKVLDKSGRTVQLSWLAPYDGNSPITRYIVEYKLLKNTWETDIEKVEATGDKTEMSVVSLHPATTYHFRIVAENGVGLSKPSDPVTIITSEEAPGGKPTNIHVDPIDENTLKVMWKAPERSDWNGEIQGYYVGYKQSSLVENKFVFETVEFSKEEGKEHYLEIFNLKTYTQYTIVVQAFNKLGAGPMSDEIKQYTSEGVPEQPPHDTTCTTLTSQTIRISWVSPPLNTANGVIKGYKVIYGPSDSWFNESTKDTKITVSSETILHGLKKFTNYSMEVLAFTAGGDGVRAPRIYCQTEQDVPEAPAALKALVMSTESVLVSWKPPAEPNGDVNQYTVYIKPSGDNKDKEPLAHKVAPNQMSFEASGLIKQDPYEFWVTASTNIGEGQPTKSIVIAPSTRVPAMIASFDDSFVATYREDVKLPCLTVGVPAPEISWKVKGAPLESNDRIRQLPEGSLLIRSVTRTDAGEYSCFVENSFGKDKITHHIVVLAPPHKPEVSVGETTSNTITLNLKPHAADKEPIHGYTIKYKPEFGDWQTAQVAAKAPKFTLENLWCGSRYQIAVTAYNLIGTGDESDLLNTKTTGSKPKIPEASKFIEVSATSVTLHLNAWLDGGCPMLYFVVEHKKKLQSEWTQVSNNVRPGGNFVVLDLDPASWYHLRVTAHNNAGFSVAEYEFASLTLSGGTIAPAREVHHNGFGSATDTAIRIILANLNLVIPVTSALLVIIVAIIFLCYLKKRGVEIKDDMTVYNQSMIMGGNTLDKRHADFNDELGYIAPPNRKLPPVPGSNYNTCDRIKRGFPGPYNGHGTWNPRARHMYEELNGSNPRCRGHLPPCPGSDETMYTRCRGIDGEDICPYATFHLLGFREEMDPSKMPFQTFPHPNGHCGTIGPGGTIASNGLMHQCPGTQTMPRNGRYSRVGGANSMFSPEYDDPANMGDEYGSQYGQYGAPYEQYESRASMAGRSIGSPEPPPPPPRNHDPNVSNTSNEANDSKDSNQISEAECDQHQQPATQNYGAHLKGNTKDGMTTEELRKLIERKPNEAPAGQQRLQSGGLTTYDTVAV
ncbi:Down syndrome cell adhesion molecule-like protein Dscam2 isoform X50 [Acyrthosiphon pisum]|uniref:Down syndrome cell adhesion molecule-like protein Dscam2 n=1 Tax=Acyrthosiphon pisum TaxID=7029 RepID=A0A8R2FAI6_ACYPI|nr:Down syndrome cell adhesion molecule-like protein Dscam2 isoform X50 [Acyrthosiphon pisum]|eukprot:XP_008186316.1 PREDICTED: Down syndrome cell adhesion molecule-like protein Dscam2 isoform X50 [Acyrthosiphon pisum]